MNAADSKTEDVPVPEWGGMVRVRSLTGRERDAFEASLIKGEGKKAMRDIANLRARLIGICLIDEAGSRVFSDVEIQYLGSKSAAALDRVFSVCQRLNGLTSADVEELEKNSEADPSDSSPSISA